MSEFEKKHFKKKWVNSDALYMIGYNRRTKEKIIVVTIPWIAWYDVYFKLTEEEYEWHRTDLESLNDLAERLKVDKGCNFYKDRLLRNEGPTS